MDSDRLILGMAGNVPYYDPEVYLSPTFLSQLKRMVMDYRTSSFNNPMGKGAYFLFEGISRFVSEHGRDIQLRMWGSVSPEYEVESKKYDIDDIVDIGGFVPKNESIQRLKECDIMVLTLALGANGNPPFSLPGKMFDYFSIGKPVLALVEESYCAQVLRESGLGIVVDPKDSAAISDTLAQLVKHKGRLHERYRLHEGFLDRFGHHRMVDEMADIFDGLV